MPSTLVKAPTAYACCSCATRGENLNGRATGPLAQAGRVAAWRAIRPLARNGDRRRQAAASTSAAGNKRSHDDDGRFWIQLPDFRQRFRTVDLCRVKNGQLKERNVLKERTAAERAADAEAAAVDDDWLAEIPGAARARLATPKAPKKHSSKKKSKKSKKHKHKERNMTAEERRP